MELRDKQVLVKLTASEREALKEAAYSAGVSTASYIRQTLLKSLRTAKVTNEELLPTLEEEQLDEGWIF